MRKCASEQPASAIGLGFLISVLVRNQARELVLTLRHWASFFNSSKAPVLLSALLSVVLQQQVF
jgi:hypothetical protein